MFLACCATLQVLRKGGPFPLPKCGLLCIRISMSTSWRPGLHPGHLITAQVRSRSAGPQASGRLPLMPYPRRRHDKTAHKLE